MADIKKERERREREEVYDPRTGGWAPRFKNQRNMDRQEDEEREALMSNNNRPVVRAPY